MTSPFARLVPALLAAAALLPLPAQSAGVVGQAAPACELARLDVNEPAPNFDLKQFRGRVVYVDFWASWCGPCAQAFPFLNRLDDEFREQGLQVVGVNVDEQAEAARLFLRRHPAGFTIGTDPQGHCPRAFAVAGMPSSYLIDRDGIVRYQHIGFRPGDAAERREQVRRLLEESSKH